MADPELEICELFYSLAGESSKSGTPALFVRLAGCNLRCSWCDTKKSWDRGKNVSVRELLSILTDRNTKLVVITGGEPLLHAPVVVFCDKLLAAGKTVQVETNGSLDISVLPKGVQVVMDYKPPSSKEMKKMDMDNLARLKPGDDLKIVIADRNDFLFACKFVAQHPVPDGVEIFLSPASGTVEASDLAQWMLDSHIDARLQVQLHRIVWDGKKDGNPLDELIQNSPTLSH